MPFFILVPSRPLFADHICSLHGLSNRTSQRPTNDLDLDAVLDRLGGLDGRVSSGGGNLFVGDFWRILMAQPHLGACDLILVDAPETALDHAGIAMLVAALHRRLSTVLVATGSLQVARTMGLPVRLLYAARGTETARKDHA